jgi:2-polyprenyl-3-methyl-5-hydroxy-6-metoxy-1,4-benzoquinol methylase
MKNSFLKDLNIEKKVLKSFKKITPSKIKIENNSVLIKYTKWHEQLFFNLKFPTKMFNKSNVIDFGCGTGEVDVVLARYGAKVNAFDYNDKSINRANYLKKKFKLTKSLIFKTEDINKVKIKKNAYDIAFSAGVIAHVKNPRLMFENMCKVTKVDGYLILGYIEDSGLIQRLFHRAIIKKYKNFNFNQKKKIVLKLFPEHIERSVKYGSRSIDSIINDYIDNPLYNGLNIKNLNDWAYKKNFKFYNSVPNIIPTFNVNPGYIEQISFLKKEFNTLLSFNRLRWMFAQNTDEQVFKKFKLNSTSLSKEIEDYMGSVYEELQSNNINYSNLYKKSLKGRGLNTKIYKYISTFNASLSENLLNSVESIIKLTKILNSNKNHKLTLNNDIRKNFFKGYNGLGTSYAIWKKIK